jgi:hypothetical protein
MKKSDGTTDWWAIIIWIAIIVFGIYCIFKIVDRPDRELTPQEKSDNVSICHQYYGNSQEYQDCVNGSYGKD